ncbi:MAG TPA: ATP-binding cassette domain-containing protein [Gaiellaceae bacterium]|nr:ATP-binding cassette domain-containing protein [Gaiellaceae bacterium]
MSRAVDVRDAFRIFPSSAGGTPALQGLTLAVEEGEIVVALGPSGSGKTTLLRAVGGLEWLSAGSATVLGTDLGRASGRALSAFRAERVGLLDQHYARSLSPDLTCRQTVTLQLRLLGRDAASSRRAADELMDRVGLQGRGDARPAELSGGEQQRVAVCASLAHRPRLLLADEPAGELDQETAEEVYRLLSELVRERGGSALIVSHDPGAAAVADRQVWIRDGRIVEEARGGGGRTLVATRGWIRLPGAPLDSTVTPAEVAERLAEPPDDPSRDAVPVAAPDAPAVAELIDIGKRYGSRTVLEEVTTAFVPGRIAAIVGRSGSGKTTLLHLLAGLERPSSGVVKVGGRELGDLNRSQLADLRRRRIALVTQEPGLVPYLSALENVELGLALRGASADGAREALDAVGIEESLRHPVMRLSAGERQRVAIARALAADVDILLLDEPTARLDEANASSTCSLLARLTRERGTAVVCATHDPLLVELASEIVELGVGARTDSHP